LLTIKEKMGFKAVLFSQNFKSCQASENFKG